eukprot:777580-Amphidinium_carterae.3
METHGVRIVVTQQYKNLGCIIDAQCRDGPEVSKRVASPRVAGDNIPTSVLRARHLSTKRKLNLVSAYEWVRLMYGRGSLATGLGEYNSVNAAYHRRYAYCWQTFLMVALC